MRPLETNKLLNIQDQYLDPPSLLPYNFPDWNSGNVEDLVADGQSLMLDHRYTIVLRNCFYETLFDFPCLAFKFKTSDYT